MKAKPVPGSCLAASRYDNLIQSTPPVVPLPPLLPVLRHAEKPVIFLFYFFFNALFSVGHLKGQVRHLIYFNTGRFGDEQI